MRHYLFIIPALFFAAVYVQAADQNAPAAVSAAMEELFPDMDVSSIRESKIPGLYEVMSGTEVFYISADGQYLLQGDLFDLSQRRNLTEAQRASVRIDVLNNIPVSEYIEFAPENPEHVIYVFTDVSCGYCRRLHNDVPRLNRNGLAVRYLAFPRQGTGSSTYKQMVSVWCAEDPKAALTAAKQGQHIQPASCRNPVQDQFNLGRSLGVRGTPAIYMDDGREIPGYRPPEELLRLVNGEG
ncbi:MAG: DsbC family protein [Gammaproteobacteria bacterium]